MSADDKPVVDEIAALIAKLEDEVPDGPGRPLGLLRVAEFAAERKQKVTAARLARQAITLSEGDPRILNGGRRVLHGLIPGYHAPMMNDVRRNAAWDAALRRAIRPGMHVYEIGTGAGMLAMMAARAGAEHVTTCEVDPIVADLAREVIAHNGYADRITVLTKRTQNVALERPADLLFCDIFGDNLFDFDPLTLILDAKARLLKPDAVVMPRRVSMQVALATWDDFARSGQYAEACGFDLSPMRDFGLARQGIIIQSPDLHLRSAPCEILGFDLSSSAFEREGAAEVVCEADSEGEVNGLARWIRLELDGEATLEARPERDAIFFSALKFIAAPAPARLRTGDRRRVHIRYSGKRIETWLDEA